MDLNSLKKQISDISSRSKHVFDAASSKPELDDIYRSFLGKKGKVNILLKSLGSLPQDKRKDAGLLLNKLKEELESLYTSTSQTLIARANSERLSKDSVDVTLPGFQSYKGSLHPVSQTIKEISDFFERMGFDIETGPEAEIDYYNFEALNVPEDHPAKDMHDTFYLSNSGLLRTHTSPVQIRTMEKSEPPHRIICPGKVYRIQISLIRLCSIK